MASRWRFETIAGVLIIADEGISTPSLTGSFSENFGQTHDLVLTANQVYTVTMMVNVGARAASATAFIDPIFAFGPGAGPEYSFSFNEGIGAAPVPEPGIFLMLGAGLPLLLVFSRRKTGRASAAGM